MTTLGGQLIAQARRSPDRAFLTWSGADASPEALTYAEACRRVSGVARRLRDLGVGRGDCVAAVMENGPDLAILLYATSSLGAVLAMFDARLTEYELTPLIAALDPLVVVASEHGRRVDARATVKPDVLTRDIVGVDTPPLSDPGDARLPVAIVYTSGSTGGPKGCVLSHNSLLRPAQAMVDRLAVTSDDILLNVLPLHHMAGLSFLATGATAAATVAIRGRFSGSRFWTDVRETGATVFRHIGEMLSVLCHQPADQLERDHRLRLVYGGGADSAVARRFTARFGVPTIEGYGLSETNTILAGSTTRSVPGTLGEPLPHLEVRLVDATGSLVPGAGEGELEVSPNPALMLGYYGAPDLTARALRDGWFRTGDLVRRDELGNYHFVRRMNDVIRRRGESIDPSEIERAAAACPGVRRAAAVGIRDRDGRVEIRLFVEPNAARPIASAEVKRHLAALLAPFKIPRDVVIGAIPRTATEKIDKPALLRLSDVSS